VTADLLDAFLVDVRGGKLSAVGPLADWLGERGDAREAAVRALWDAYFRVRRKMLATRIDGPYWEMAVRIAVSDHNAAWLNLQHGVLELFPSRPIAGVAK
jgi:hypothetical protein